MHQHPEILSVLIDDKGQVASDLVCPSCRYNLRGIQQDGACPECGFAVEKAILTANTRRWTRLQVVLSILAIAYGVVLPIVNFVLYRNSHYAYATLAYEQVLIGFVALWLLGGLAWSIALAIAASNRISTRTCLLIMVAVLAESVIAVMMIAMEWARYLAF